MHVQTILLSTAALSFILALTRTIAASWERGSFCWYVIGWGPYLIAGYVALNWNAEIIPIGGFGASGWIGGVIAFITTMCLTAVVPTWAACYISLYAASTGGRLRRIRHETQSFRRAIDRVSASDEQGH
jgi:hypothetical protein